MAAQLIRLAAAIALFVPVYGINVTMGVPFLGGVTASKTSGSANITISAQPRGEQQFEANQILLVPGETGPKIVTAIAQSGDPATVSTTLTLANYDWSAFSASATTSGMSLTLLADRFDHTSLHVWARTDADACLAVAFDTSSHTTGSAYQYVTLEMSNTVDTCAGQRTHALTVVGLNPATRFYFRITAKPTMGPDNSAAVSDDAHGATEFSLVTPPDNHFPDGRPPDPTLPEDVAAQVVAPPDETGYTVVPIPPAAWPSTPVTGSISGGTTLLATSVALSNSLVGHWLVIDGVRCPGHSLGPVGHEPPWCRIASISGTLVTLEQPASNSVSGAAVNWGLYTLKQWLDAGTYGTVYEWKQGYVAKWFPTIDNTAFVYDFPLRIPGMALAAGASSIDDPTHKWIVLRTAPTPAALPPTGVRTGPEYESVLGGIETQENPGGSYPSSLAFTLSGLGENGMPAHHIRFQNLKFVPAASAANEADPIARYGPVGSDGLGTYIPRYIAIDRLLVKLPNMHTRARFTFPLAAQQLAVLNSYVEVDYWRPWIYSPGSITASTNTINLTGVQWQRNKYDASLVIQGAATVTATGTASGDVAVYGVMDATAGGDGMEIRYTSGRGITLACAACRAVNGLSDPTPTAKTAKTFFQTLIPSGGNTVNSPSVFPDSVWETEGPKGFEMAWGHHWLFQNNRVRAYSIGWFLDIPPSYTQAFPSPRHITLRRNDFDWSKDHRNSATETNGYRYIPRHCGIEFKRGDEILLEGNTFTECWARGNQGAAIAFSMTLDVYPAATAHSNNITVRHNRFDRVPGTILFNSYYLHGSPTQGSDMSRIYVGNNLAYLIDGEIQHDPPGPPNPLWGHQLAMTGCHDCRVEHNTWYDARSNYPVMNYAGEYRMEGLWFLSNVWYGNVSGGHGQLHAQAPYWNPRPMLPAMTEGTFVSGGTYLSAYNSFVNRLTGSSVLSTFKFAYNAVICGSTFNVADDYRTLTNTVDFTNAECTAQLSKWAGLTSTNYFINTGETKAARTTAFGLWANPGAFDFRFAASSAYLGALKTHDGLTIGADVAEIDRKRGTISNLSAVDIHPAGPRCAGLSGTSCATIAAIVPDRGASCQVAYGAHGSAQSGWTVTSPDTSTGDSRAFALAGLAAGSYDATMMCAGAPPVSPITFTAP